MSFEVAVANESLQFFRVIPVDPFGEIPIGSLVNLEPLEVVLTSGQVWQRDLRQQLQGGWVKSEAGDLVAGKLAPCTTGTSRCYRIVDVAYDTVPARLTKVAGSFQGCGYR